MKKAGFQARPPQGKAGQEQAPRRLWRDGVTRNQPVRWTPEWFRPGLLAAPPHLPRHFPTLYPGVTGAQVVGFLKGKNALGGPESPEGADAA